MDTRNYIDCAGSYSRIFDNDDLSVSDHIFRYFKKVGGPYTIDVFANCKNNKTIRFYSKYWNPGSTGVDAFAYD